ncbi:receptor protein kinase-like protein ZAR1 [Punica granatum]|uniref:Protein kinase domain-containing protein n=2 Tax=Punica granatum TaxID=22663 RepID=A0A218W4H2_PUNGR|nr:receptor protein kinase-like protein ZAR1 [Punica granatum]OWM67200.1 hypothetical protein CDL15_Pgr000652 [Punica granatum]PKI72197.1 hypothetical protein CRG98_007395 [Punica granatum]
MWSALTLPVASAVFLAVFLICPSSSYALTSDGLSLLALKAAVTGDPTRVLDSWAESDATPCHWAGVVCTRARVTSLFLPGKGLTGYIPSELGLLGSLRRLDLARNNFSRPVPSRLFNATSLVSLDLSHNSLSGFVPDQIRALRNLTHLDLSLNLFNGSLPEGLAELTGLSGTLNLSCNMFSGGIPESYGHFPVMVSLDLQHNNLTGKIPQVGSLLNQGPTAFAGNPSLCGFPLATPCPEAQDPRVFSNPDHPQNPKATADTESDPPESGRRRDATSFVVGVISGVFASVAAVSVSVWALLRKLAMKRDQMMANDKAFADISSSNAFDEEGQKGKFVVMDEGFNLELEDLLRASAYVVGKNRGGIVYKVVAGRGAGVGPTVLAVRRLSEGDVVWRLKEFESEVEAIGRVHHPNIVPLRAYYFADDEKLLVSDFIRNGSLHAALHGEFSKTSPPLTWAARLKIAQGTARGLAHIHDHSPRKYVHGNIKSTKILLDEEHQPHISGFGLTRLVSGTSGFTTSSSKKHSSSSHTILGSGMELRIGSPSNSYLAPEARVSGNKFTQKCDVYSFGIILMEILTGRLPDSGPEGDGKGLEGLVKKVFHEERPLSEIIDPNLLHEVHAKKQVIATFHIALNCTEIDPELRPRMRVVSESLDRIKLV